MSSSEELVAVRGELLGNEEFDQLWRSAKALAAGRMFKDVTQAEQAFSKMLIGYYLGLNPSQSMMGIHLVRGNVQMSYPTMGAFVKSRPGYDYKILEHTDERAVIEFFRDSESLGTATFTVEDAKRAKLVKSDGGWETYPENMCVARALSKGIRFFMPEALGGIPVYTVGEIPPVTELTEGEGTGEPVGLELAPEIEEVIARAEQVGHPGLAERVVWEYYVRRKDADVPTKVREAHAELDDFVARQEAKAAQAIQDADVVEPDVPIDLDDLPEVDDPNDPLDPEATPEVADHIDYLDVTEKNQRWYRHLGCTAVTGAAARWVVPLDDVGSPEGQERECESCSQTLPVRRSPEQILRDENLGGGQKGEAVDKPTSSSPVAQPIPEPAVDTPQSLVAQGRGAEVGEEDLGGGEARADETVPLSSSAAPKGQSAAREVPEIERLRARLRLYEGLDATTEEEKAEKEEEIAKMNEKLKALGAAEADENPDQERLL